VGGGDGVLGLIQKRPAAKSLYRSIYLDDVYLSMLYGLFEPGLEPPDKMVTVPLITNLFCEFL
jgi:hypothetical protein